MKSGASGAAVTKGKENGQNKPPSSTPLPFTRGVELGEKYLISEHQISAVHLSADSSSTETLCCLNRW